MRQNTFSHRIFLTSFKVAAFATLGADAEQALRAAARDGLELKL